MGTTAVVVLFSGCVKDRETDFSGKQIVFAASTGTLETRTEYGVDNASGSVSYVDWVDGDGITILMSPGSSANYTITNVHDGNDTDGISKASIAPSGGGTGLAWGESGSYDFYAMYPASGTNGSSLDASSMTAVIPATWYATDANVDKLPYGYMLATATGISAQADAVPLVFNPKYTSFCFTLKNPTSSSVTLESVSLSSATKALSGTYSVATSNGDVTLASGNSNKTIKADFTGLDGGGLTILDGTPADPGTKTFTIVTVPDSFNDLTVTIKTTGGIEKCLPLKKTENSTTKFIFFAAHKKHNLNITLPDYTYTFSVTDQPEIAYDGSVTSPATVLSKNSDNEAVPWFVEGYYATEADALSGQNRSATSFASVPDCSSPSNVSTNPTLSVTADSSPLGLKDYINETIKNSTFGAHSSEDRYINLANPANLVPSSTESDAIVESANCYIVNGPGYYRIPLVMGNGVGADNSEFYNYLGTAMNAISSSNLSDQGGIPTSAVVVWDDVTSDGSWIDNCFVDGNWLKFHISRAKAQQANVLIAIKDNNTPTPRTMWSYHIWMTDYIPSNYPAYDSNALLSDITFTNKNNIQYTIPPYNLGWVVENTKATYYHPSTIYVVLRQGTPSSPEGHYAIMRIERPDYVADYSLADTVTGHGLYYQWGRPVPLQGTSPYGGTTTLTAINVSGNTSNHVLNGLQNPQASMNSWLSGRTDAYTFWDSDNTTTNTDDDSVSKTMYDPSPANYSLPSRNYLNGFSYDGTYTEGHLVYSSQSLYIPPKLDYRSGTNMHGSTKGSSYYWTADSDGNGSSTCEIYGQESGKFYSTVGSGSGSAASGMSIRSMKN